MTTCPHCQEDVDTATLGGGVVKFTHHGDCPGGFARVELVDTDLESRYTEPSDLCPHPERWHSADWDSAEVEITDLVAAFVNATRPDLVIETGSAFGQTAYAIGTVLSAVDVGVLHTIEIAPDRAEHTRRRCDGLPVKVEEMSSLDFEPPGEVGFAWFDSLLPLRVPEFEHFYPYLAPGAIVGFHDTAPHHGYELWPQIEHLEALGKLLPIRLRTPRGAVFGEVVK